MRVWDYIEKEWVDNDATRWTAEWSTDPTGKVASGELSLHEAQYESRSFGSKGKGLAIAHAKKLLESDVPFCGCVQVFKEYVEIVDGDAGNWERDHDSTIELTHADLVHA